MNNPITPSEANPSDDRSLIIGGNNSKVLYALTMRHNPTYKKGTKTRYTEGEKRDLYNASFDVLRLSYDFVPQELVFEKKNGLHVHGYGFFKKKVPLLKTIKLQDFHFKWKKVYNQQGWIDYIRKESSDAYNRLKKLYSSYAFR